MKEKIRVGIIGVGNNASALVQGIYHYRSRNGKLPLRGEEGIRFPTVCGFGIDDVEFSAAFDVDSRKIGLDLGSAIFSAPNCYPRVLEVNPTTGVVVKPSPVLDGVPEFLGQMVDVSPESASSTAEGLYESCAASLRQSRTEVLINFLPSGSDKATEFFARLAAHTGASYINCTPSPAAHSPSIVKLFEDSKVPLLGDDLESQFGSSLLHRTILEALESRGLEVRHSYQVNLGGNTDFKNLSHRPDAKKRSKMTALNVSGSAAGKIDVLPSGGFIPGLGDNKVGYIVVEGRGWLGTPVTIDLRLKVQDSSNAIGVTIDLIRLARGAMIRGLSGAIPLSYYFKNPVGPKMSTEKAIEAVMRFDRGELL